tara:strand:- start:4749 stop:5123 length:375 start_codon:yes stop_codon:yes gene_type:complete
MERLPSADSIPEIPLTLKGKIKMKNVGYEIIIWSGGDNHITGEIATGTVGIFDPDEHKWALMDYMQKIEEGFLGAYLTVKKYTGGNWVEFGHNMDDCEPLSNLPKYLQKKLRKLISFDRARNNL